MTDRRTRRRRSVVEHTRYQEAYERLRECHRCGEDDDPEHLKLLGASGAGKSTLLRDYAERFPRREEATRTIVPVVYARMPTSPTPTRLAGRILRSMKSPCWNKGKEDERTFQLTTLAANCDVEMFLIDEAQRAVDRGRAKTHSRVADWIIDFADEVRRPIVLGGLPRIQLLDGSNGQFGRRFSSEFTLDRFSTLEQDQALVQSLVEAFCEELGIRLASAIELQDFARRLTYASHGAYGYMWKLFRKVARRLDAENREAAGVADFLDAFLTQVWPEAPAPRQPFHADFEWVELNKPGEPFSPDAPEAGW
jgi:hypothetical protein